MNDQRDDRQARIDWSWLDLELIFFAIAGLVVIGLGVRAFAYWAVGEWTAGRRLLPTLAFGGAAATIAALLLVLRHRKRWLYLGTALTIIAIVTAILASAGTTVPPSWVH
jgi:hypothetical protein